MNTLKKEVLSILNVKTIEEISAHNFENKFVVQEVICGGKWPYLSEILDCYNIDQFFEDHKEEINYLVAILNRLEFSRGESVFTLPEFDVTDLLCIEPENKRFLITIALEETLRQII